MRSATEGYFDGICKHCLKPIRQVDTAVQYQDSNGVFREKRGFGYIHCGTRYGCKGHPAVGPNAQVAEPLTLEEVNKQLNHILVSVV